MSGGAAEGLSAKPIDDVTLKFWAGLADVLTEKKEFAAGSAIRRLLAERDRLAERERALTAALESALSSDPGWMQRAHDALVQGWSQRAREALAGGGEGVD